MKNYKELTVWQKAMELVKEVYTLVKLLPKEETYALSDQMRRSAVSVPSNIAEGYCRSTDKELGQFLYIARGSCTELETQILIGISLNYFNDSQSRVALQLCTEVAKMLNGFIKQLAISR